MLHSRLSCPLCTESVAITIPEAATKATSGTWVVVLRVGRDGPAFFVLGERLQHELAHAMLRAYVGNGAQQREAATFTIDGVLACRERHGAAVATASLPDGEPDQLQAIEFAVDEMQLGIREFAGRVAT
jgi:hypothetical protein